MIIISALVSFWNAFWPYLVAVLIFLLLIVIHEFGHFIIAKLFKVKVNEFAVGFGPKIFKFQGKETLYRFNLIPFGGYCAMEGEDETSDDPRAFCNAKAYKRFLIVAAGAIFNLLLGLIIVAIIVCSSHLVGTTKVHSFRENAVSVNSGLQVGDKIVEINGRKMFTTNDIMYAFTAVNADQNGKTKLDMTVVRDGKKVPLNVEFNYETDNGINYIVLDFSFIGEEKTVLNVISSTFKTTFSYCRTVWFSLIDLISGRFGISAVSGPVGVTTTIGQAAKMGLMNILPIMALITVNLGIFNLLPVPALDGGRLLFIFFEMITGKKLSKKYEGVIHAVGLVLLLLLMALVTFKDIWSLIAG